MSIREPALSAAAIQRALTIIALVAVSAAVAAVLPFGATQRADAQATQVTPHTRPIPSGVTASTVRWSTTGSIVADPWRVAPGVVIPLITIAGEPGTVAGGFAAQGFISERARGIDALARVEDRLKAEHEAALAAAAAAAAEAEAAAAAQAAAQAAAVAAAQAAAQAVAQAKAQASADAAARAAQGFVQRVWTSGFQNEINQCRGAVDVTGVYQVRVIAEHSSCGGNRFPTSAGAVVTITGLDAGRYRVIGVVAHLNGEVDHAEDIPRGYDLLFQTCVDGFTNMRFTALQRIG